MDRGCKVLKTCYWVAILVATSSTLAAEDVRIPRHLLWQSQDQALPNPLEFNECLNSEDSNQIALGRIAFNSPRLLGGQAGRMGLSCNGCHVAGRGNPRFFIEQISSRPGTVDLTNAFFSSRGGDNTFNPIPIPDLSDRDGLKFAVREGEAFEQHISNLIQTEFDGQPPPPTIMSALLVYLDALDSAACHHTRTSNSIAGYQQLLHESLEQIGVSLSNDDLALARFLIKSFRAALESVYLLVGDEPDERIDAGLLKLSRSAESLLNKLSDESGNLHRIENLNNELAKTFLLIRQNSN